MPGCRHQSLAGNEIVVQLVHAFEEPIIRPCPGGPAGSVRCVRLNLEKGE